MGRERFSNDQVEQVLGHLFSGLSVFHAEICEWLIDADLSQQFLADGSRDLVQWVEARFGVRHSTAGLLVRVARRLEDLPLLRKRFAAGELSLDQVDAISKLATPETEEKLIDECIGLSNAMLDRLARRAHPPSVEDERSVWERRHLGLQWNLDESELRFGGSLPGAEGKVFESAVRQRADRCPVNPDTGMFDPYPARMADGLVEMAATATTAEASAPGFELVLYTDLEALTMDAGSTGLAELEAGPVLWSETARRLGCDSMVECVIQDHDLRVLGIGRRSRIIPRWLRRQLWHRDGGCRFPGCGTTLYVHGHHIKHWADLGPTELENLILLCGYHHRFVHEHGWRIRTAEHENRFVFLRPDGRVYPPPLPALDPRLSALVRT